MSKTYDVAFDRIGPTFRVTVPDYTEAVPAARLEATERGFSQAQTADVRGIWEHTVSPFHEVKTFIVTFPVGGPLAQNYLRFVSTNELSARLALVGAYTQRGWAGIYDEVEGMATVRTHGLEEVPFGWLADVAGDYPA